MLSRMWVWGAVASSARSCAPGEHTGDDRRAGARAREQIARGIARHRDLAHVVDPELQHRVEHEIGMRPAATRR